MSPRRMPYREAGVEAHAREGRTIELTGTFLLTEELVSETPVPLTLIGPVGGTARLRAVGDGSTVSHRILTVGTWLEEVTVTVTLERLVLADGDVAGNTGDNDGGAVLASVEVVLVNVTFVANVAGSGGAVHMDVIGGTPGAKFDATFVTFRDNEASDPGGGAGLFLSADTAVDLPIVLRGCCPVA